MSIFAIDRSALDKGWQMRSARIDVWHPATVPGVVHTDLMAAGSIEDPFFGLNERGVQWVDKEDWIYQTGFDLPANLAGKEHIELFFEGLDTYADVYLNDKKILAADNMFREWRVDIKAEVKPTGNILKIYFHSPIRIAMPQWEALPYKYRSSNDQSENGGLLDRKVGIFTRKAGYHYGWDWGPRLVTSGIWRPVWIEGWDAARIDNVQVVQQDVSAKSAKLSFVAEVLSDRDRQGVILDVTCPTDPKLGGSKTVDLVKGVNKVAVDFVVKNPKLWWSNGLGEAHLYNFTATLAQGAEGTHSEKIIFDTHKEKIGIRSLMLVRKPDAVGRSFYFELNGVPIFAKGANYVPSDSFLPRVTDSDYERTILDAVKANMNMLRVWGGGIYENDVFYDLCDKYGIMVWQDFMFGCAVFPAEGAMLENIRQEAIENVKRLRNHPSIALWCGNNENLDAWFNWGWKKGYEAQNPQWADIIWKQFSDQYFVVLPEVVARYDPARDYTPSSPFTDYDGRRDFTDGDYHYWEVWHGKKPITEYNVVKSRFFSEYGFQSFPELATVKTYAPDPKDWDIHSEVMLAHQRAGAHANGLIESYLLAEYRKPVDFPAFLYMNHILQGDAIKTAMEAHRRDMPWCMGSLFWQHNDCWPVASWSSRDYYGRWKAMHYYARKAYDNVLVSPVEENGALEVYAVSDLQKDFDADLTVRAMLMDGTPVKEFKRRVKVTANTSTNVFSESIEEVMAARAKGDVIVAVSLQSKDGLHRSNIFYAVKQKDMNYPKTTITRTVRAAGEGVEVMLKSEKFARGVYLSVEEMDNFFQDNYFDILPGQSVTVKVRTGLTPVEFEKQLKVISLSDAY